jgi:hypothetical protein
MKLVQRILKSPLHIPCGCPGSRGAGTDGSIRGGGGLLPYIATMDMVIPLDSCVRPLCWWMRTSRYVLLPGAVCLSLVLAYEMNRTDIYIYSVCLCVACVCASVSGWVCWPVSRTNYQIRLVTVFFLHSSILNLFVLFLYLISVYIFAFNVTTFPGFSVTLSHSVFHDEQFIRMCDFQPKFGVPPLVVCCECAIFFTVAAFLLSYPTFFRLYRFL